MKKTKTIMALLLSFILVLEISPIQVDAAVRINAKKKTLTIGQSFALKVRGTKKKVRWSSSNKSVATVSSKGKVKAKKVGKATITAKVAKKSLKCKVKVEKKQDAHTQPQTTVPTPTLSPTPVATQTTVPTPTLSPTPVATQTTVPTPTLSPTPVATQTTVPTPTLSPTPEPTFEPGSKENPLSAYEEFESDLYDYNRENIGRFKIRLIDYKEGDEAYNLVKNNPYNKDPKRTQEYIYFKFELSHLSGDLTDATDIIRWPTCWYRKGSDQYISIEGYGSLFEDVQSFTETDLDVGESAICSMALLTTKKDEPMIYNILTGYDEETHKYKYIWFTTER